MVSLPLLSIDFFSLLRVSMLKPNGSDPLPLTCWRLTVISITPLETETSTGKVYPLVNGKRQGVCNTLPIYKKYIIRNYIPLIVVWGKPVLQDSLRYVLNENPSC